MFLLLFYALNHTNGTVPQRTSDSAATAATTAGLPGLHVLLVLSHHEESLQVLQGKHLHLGALLAGSGNAAETQQEHLHKHRGCNSVVGFTVA